MPTAVENGRGSATRCSASHGSSTRQGIAVSTPAPSEASPSAPTPPRCSIAASAAEGELDHFAVRLARHARDQSDAAGGVVAPRGARERGRHCRRSRDHWRWVWTNGPSDGWCDGHSRPRPGPSATCHGRPDPSESTRPYGATRRHKPDWPERMTMTDQRQAAIEKLVKDENVKHIQLWFTDILGNLKMVEVPDRQLPNVIESGAAFDGSSISGYAEIEESDIVAMPDWDTFTVLPWASGSERTAFVFCDVLDRNYEPFEGDPRWVLRRQLERAKEHGPRLLRRPRARVLLLQGLRQRPSSPTTAATSTCCPPTSATTCASRPCARSTSSASRWRRATTRSPRRSTRSTRTTTRRC